MTKPIMIYNISGMVGYLHPGVQCPRCDRPGANVVPFHGELTGSIWTREEFEHTQWGGYHFDCALKVFSLEPQVMAQIHQFVKDHPDLILEYT